MEFFLGFIHRLLDHFEPVETAFPMRGQIGENHPHLIATNTVIPAQRHRHHSHQRLLGQAIIGLQVMP